MTTSPNLLTIYITFYPAIDMYGFFYALWDEISTLLQGFFCAFWQPSIISSLHQKTED